MLEDMRGALTGGIQRHPDFVKDITRESPLRLPGLSLSNLRLLLRPVRNLELGVEQVHAPFCLI